MQMLIAFWGDWGSDIYAWTFVVFNGGPGIVPCWPELTRCGWWCSQLGDNGMPARGAWGPLPGPVQTVGRAERKAVPQALKLIPKVSLIVADLLSLQQVGSQRGTIDADAQANYADLWQGMFHVAGPSTGPTRAGPAMEEGRAADSPSL